MHEAGKALVIYLLAARAMHLAQRWSPKTVNTVLEGHSGTPARQLHTLWSHLFQGEVEKRTASEWLLTLFPDAASKDSEIWRLVNLKERQNKLFVAEYNDQVVSIDRVRIETAGREVTDHSFLYWLIVKMIESRDPFALFANNKSPKPAQANRLLFLHKLHRRLFQPHAVVRLGIHGPVSHGDKYESNLLVNPWEQSLNLFVMRLDEFARENSFGMDGEE